MGVFAFGMSGFINSNQIGADYCFDLQHEVFAFHYNNGASIDDAWEESIQVFEKCERRYGR